MLDPAVRKEPTIGRSQPDLVGPTGPEPGKQTRVQETYGKTAGLMLRSSESPAISERPPLPKRAKGADDKIGQEIDKQSAVRRKHVSDAGERPLVSGEDPRPPGLKQAHEELARGRYFWMPYIKGGSRKLEAFLEDIQNGTTAVYARCIMAQRTEDDAERSFFDGWATRLDNQVAMIHLARRVWFEGNWADPNLQQATSWSDLIARSEAKLGSPQLSGAAQSAFQSRVAGFRALADVSDPEFIEGAMQAVHTANAGWKTAPEPPPIAQADAAKPGGQAGNVAGNVASNYTVTQEATRAQTIAKLNGSATATTVANAPPERTALETVGHYAMLTALAPLAGAYHLLSGGGHDWSGGMADEAKGMPGDFTTNLEKVQDRRTAAWEERERAQAGSMQSEIPATLNLYECPMSEGTLARLMQIWNKGWWFNYGEAELAQIREFRGMLSAINAKYKHLTDVEFRKPRTAESAAAFSWYDNAGTWVHIWAGRLERGLELWGGARGATIRRIGPNAKNWSQLEAAMKAKVEADAAKPEGWFGLSDAQDAVVDAKRGIENFVALNREGPHDYHKEEWALTKDSGSNNRSGKLLPQV